MCVVCLCVFAFSLCVCVGKKVENSESGSGPIHKDLLRRERAEREEYANRVSHGRHSHCKAAGSRLARNAVATRDKLIRQQLFSVKMKSNLHWSTLCHAGQVLSPCLVPPSSAVFAKFASAGEFYLGVNTH